MELPLRLPQRKSHAAGDLPNLIAKLVHLAPPQADGRVRIDRFSPYFESPESSGLPPAQPIRAYRHVFPFGDRDLANPTSPTTSIAMIPDRQPAIPSPPGHRPTYSRLSPLWKTGEDWPAP